MARLRDTVKFIWRCTVDRLDRYGTWEQVEAEAERLRVKWGRGPE